MNPIQMPECPSCGWWMHPALSRSQEGDPLITSICRNPDCCLSIKAGKWEILESSCDDHGRATSRGKVIATNLSEDEADEILDRLYADDRIWWKSRCSTEQKES